MAAKKKTRKKSGSSGKANYPRDHSAGEFRASHKLGTAILSGATFAGKPVQYSEVDGIAIVEGDIELGPIEQVKRSMDTMRAIAADPRRVELQGVIRSGEQFRWPDCRVPYEIDDGLANQSRVTDAIAHWEANTSFRFVLRTPENQAQFPDYVTFITGSGCSSAVGRQGGQQFVRLSSGCTTGNAIHEIGHVVGLWHEQSREDRDSFVTINWENIITGFENNFDQRITDGDDVGAYDYGSIMHYPRDAFSSNGEDTITPLVDGVDIGQRNGLSAGDIAAANSMCPPPTLRFIDELPTLKFIDDGEMATLKFRDDPTLKFSDDPTLKFSDDPTLKFSDDPTLKFSDDPTLKFSDDPTQKFSDDPTLKFSDDPTQKFSDDPTLKFSDDPTQKFSDDPTLKFSDDGGPPTFKFSDDGGTGPKFLQDQTTPPFGGSTPFVLSTPHHSDAWQHTYPDAYRAEAGRAEARLGEIQEMLMQAAQAEQQGMLSAVDRQHAEALYEEYMALGAQLQSPKGGRR